MRYVLALLAFAGCGNGTCPTVVSQSVSGGGGTVVDGQATLAQSAFEWDASTVVGSGVANADFTFGDPMSTHATLSCASIPWSNLAKAHTSVIDSCTLGIAVPSGVGYAWSYADAVPVTITASSTKIDDTRTTVTLTFDLSSSDVVATDTDGTGTHDIHLELDALAGTVDVAEQSCGGCGSSGGVYGYESF